MATDKGEINYLVVLKTDVSAFTAGVWWDDFKLALKYFSKWEKIAIVSDQDRIKTITETFGFAFPGEPKGFKLAEYNEAVFALPVKRTVLMIVVMPIFVLFSCAKKMSFGISPIVPAAEGSIKVKSDKNKNYMIDLSVIRLSEPSRLTPPKSTYVVWMQTTDNGIKKIGNLTTGSGLFQVS